MPALEALMGPCCNQQQPVAVRTQKQATRTHRTGIYAHNSSLHLKIFVFLQMCRSILVTRPRAFKCSSGTGSLNNALSSSPVN